MKIKLSPEKMKRKYNATYRLRKKTGKEKFKARGKNIEIDENIAVEIPEVKILLNEFGFVLVQKLF